MNGIGYNWCYCRITDKAIINYGNIDLLSRFILHADRRVRDLGIRLSLSNDFDELLEINQANSDSWYDLLPTVDHRYSTLTPETAFWVRGEDEGGKVVLTRAGRLFDLRGANLAEHLSSLRLFYDEPMDHQNAMCACEAPSANYMTGRMAISTGVWHHPDLRRRGRAGVILTGLMSRLFNALFVAQWDVAYTFGLMDDERVGRGLARANALPHAEPGITFQADAAAEAHRMSLVWFTRAEVEEDLRRAVVR